MQQLCLEGWVHGASSLSNFKKSLPLLITVSDTGHINDSAEVLLLVDLLKCNATGSRTNDEAGWLWWGMTLHCVKANLKAGSTHNKPLCWIAQIRSLSTTSNVQQHQPLHGTCCDCALTHSHTGHEHTVAVLRTVHDWGKKHHVCLESLKTHNRTAIIYWSIPVKLERIHITTELLDVEEISGHHPVQGRVTWSRSHRILQLCLHQQLRGKFPHFSVSLLQRQLKQTDPYEPFCHSDYLKVLTLKYWLVIVLVLGSRGSCIFAKNVNTPQKTHLKFQQFLSLKLWNIN